MRASLRGRSKDIRKNQGDNKSGDIESRNQAKAIYCFINKKSQEKSRESKKQTNQKTLSLILLGR